jgi:hypothetical protein
MSEIHTETELQYLALANGAAQQLFDEELAKVIKNIADPNTDATVARKLTLEVTVRPDKTRTLCPYEISVKSKLAPHTSVEGIGYLSADGAKIMQKDPNQPGLFNGSEESFDHDHTPQ